MACIDPASGRLVARILYDGPPDSGKTTTVRALARQLHRPVEDAGELDGDTLYFDRFEYAGGNFDGLPIECEVISLPGQLMYLERRLQLLMLADAVVYVLDSSAARLRDNFESLVALEQVVEHLGEPHLPLVIQANKRDLPDAAPLDELADHFAHLDTVHWRQTVATEGDGVREAFVMAVGAAAARARQLRLADRLEDCRGERSSESLRRLLEAAEAAHRAP